MRVSADRIAVVRALPSLREMLCAVPALRAIRGTAPRAHVALIALPSARWVLDRYPTYVDELIEFPGFPGIPEADVDAGQSVRFLAEMQEQGFDLAIQLHGSDVSVNAFTELLGATRMAGMVEAVDLAPDRELFVERLEGEPEPTRMVRVCENLGARPTRNAELEFPVRDEDVEHDLEPGSFACVEGLEGLDDVLEERGLKVVADACEMELGPSAAMLRDAAFVVCNDGDTSQLAEAVGTTSVVVFGPEADIKRWAPIDAERHRCLGGLGEEVELAEVVAALDELMAQRTAA